jgi:hypothetical protein
MPSGNLVLFCGLFLHNYTHLVHDARKVKFQKDKLLPVRPWPPQDGRADNYPVGGRAGGLVDKGFRSYIMNIFCVERISCVILVVRPDRRSGQGEQFRREANLWNENKRRSNR